jgi:hypothetical protein
MRSFQSGHGANRMRVVFDDRVLSFTLADDTTYGDVAQALHRLSDRPYGKAVAVSVTLPGPSGRRVQ